jgi:hypothetical protein
MLTSIVSVLLYATTSRTVEGAAFPFNGTSYVHRFSKGGLHEFTPKAQSDLKSFTDMVTINEYIKVNSGEDLARTANSVLDTYKGNKGIVVKTNSVPRTASKEAEHLIVVMFPALNFIEASFTRFLLVDGHGHSIVYSHRIYGKKAGDAMSQWLLKHGEENEKALLALPTVPKH